MTALLKEEVIRIYLVNLIQVHYKLQKQIASLLQCSQATVCNFIKNKRSSTKLIVHMEEYLSNHNEFLGVSCNELIEEIKVINNQQDEPIIKDEPTIKEHQQIIENNQDNEIEELISSMNKTTLDETIKEVVLEKLYTLLKVKFE